MRFDRLVTFYNSDGSKYDPDQGEYFGFDTVIDQLQCNVTQLSAERMQTLFGSLDEQAYTVRSPQSISFEFDYLTLGDGKHYALVQGISPLKINSVIVKEVQVGE